jgi:hypothetical protein
MTADWLGFQVSATECAVANVPVPVNVTLGFPVVAFVEKVTDPEDVPGDTGAKATVNACDEFTGIVAG